MELNLLQTAWRKRFSEQSDKKTITFSIKENAPICRHSWPCSTGSRVSFPSSLFFFRFLLQCLEDLDANLRKLNSRLFVIRGQPANVFPRLFKVTRAVLLLNAKGFFCVHKNIDPKSTAYRDDLTNAANFHNSQINVIEPNQLSKQSTGCQKWKRGK